MADDPLIRFLYAQLSSWQGRREGLHWVMSPWSAMQCRRMTVSRYPLWQEPGILLGLPVSIRNAAGPPHLEDETGASADGLIAVRNYSRR
jgi:hypothetical protein